MTSVEKAAAKHLTVSKELLKRASQMLEDVKTREAQLAEKQETEKQAALSEIKSAVDALVQGDWINSDQAEMVTTKLASEGGLVASMQLLQELGKHHRSETNAAGNGVGTPVGSTKSASESRPRVWSDRRPLNFDDTPEGQEFMNRLLNSRASF